MASSEQTSRLQSKLAGMKQPARLQSPEIVSWHNAAGTDIWAMLCASISGDLGVIDELVAKNPELLNCSYEYLTPIWFAVRENHAGLVKYFLDKGVSPLVHFCQPLASLARDRGHEDLAVFLESKLWELYRIAPDGEKLPALIRSFDKDAVRDALSHNPELVNIADARGKKPIHWAVLTRQLDLIEYLLELGVDINDPTADGARPIDLTNGDYYYRNWYRDLPPTGLQKHEVVVGYLKARGADYDLSIASKVGDYAGVRQLLDSDPALVKKMPKYSGAYSGTPLRNAASGGFYEIVKLLLERGADPNQPEPGIGTRGTALHTAISKRQGDIVKLLLRNGADPNAFVESSGNCLSIANVVGMPKEITDLIIAYGGRLTVELICYEGDIATLSQMLLANPQLPFNDDEHRVILDHKPVVELIIQYQPEVLKGFAIRSLHDPELAKWLIANGLDPNTGDWLGVTPLHRAAAEGDMEMAAIYLDSGANINAIEYDSLSTPLGWAARSEKKEMVEWLLQKGAHH
jgi:ankyrin repeat protein